MGMGNTNTRIEADDNAKFQDPANSSFLTCLFKLLDNNNYEYWRENIHKNYTNINHTVEGKEPVNCSLQSNPYSTTTRRPTTIRTTPGQTTPKIDLSPRFYHFDWENKLMDNREDLLGKQCHFSYLDFYPFRRGAINGTSLNCRNPYNIENQPRGYTPSIAYEYSDYRQYLQLIEYEPQVKQRLTEMGDTVEVDYSGYPCPDDMETHYSCFHCKSIESAKESKWEYIGKISPFAGHQEFCSAENEAYLVGAALSYTAVFEDDDKNPPIEGYPWGTLERFWGRLVNLYVAGIDVTPDYPTGYRNSCSEEYFENIRHGDCIFNQRLTIDPTKTKLKNVTVVQCGYRRHYGTRRQPTTSTQQRSLSIPVVARGCSPYHFLTCDLEYNLEQMLESVCTCHPTYSSYSKTFNDTIPAQEGNYPCVAKAGVPCKFEKNNDNEVEAILPDEIPCSDGMICKDLKEIVGGDNRWKLFEKSFSGFGMNPIARDYMITKSTAMCDCWDNRTRTVFNECIAYDKEARLANNIFLVLTLVVFATI